MKSFIFDKLAFYQEELGDAFLGNPEAVFCRLPLDWSSFLPSFLPSITKQQREAVSAPKSRQSEEKEDLDRVIALLFLGNEDKVFPGRRRLKMMTPLPKVRTNSSSLLRYLEAN